MVSFTDIIFRVRDRMLASALNFAAGFWGIPYENKYLQSITIEDGGVSLPVNFLCRIDPEALK
jgi:hypothetical protein